MFLRPQTRVGDGIAIPRSRILYPGRVTSRDDAAALDASDPLAGFRALFDLRGGVYLAGNSLGPPPRAVRRAMERLVGEEWPGELVSGWTEHGWIDLPAALGDRIGRLLGAAPGQVVVADSTSVNLFKVLAAALALRPDRGTVVTEAGNFPTDVYIADGVARQGAGRDLVVVEDGGDVAAAVDGDTAVVMLSHVGFRDGRLLDLEGLTAAAHAAGALAVWDLSHSAGVVPVTLDDSGVDFAVGCTYKYLNGGPGAPAFLYVAHRHQSVADQPLSGWMGHARPFALERDYEPAPGIGRMLTGTPPVVALAVLQAGIDVVAQADIGAVRRKSQALSELFIALVEERCAGLGVTLASPREPDRRGSQVCFRHAHAYPVVRALVERGVVGDFREPDVVRFGLAPLFLRHVDVWDAVEALRDVLVTRTWDRPELKVRRRVT